jgi:uncharacterized protein (TIGR03083 family)
MDELAVLATSHQRLRSILADLGEQAASAQSYDDDWTIGDVASHLGSGAQIFGLFLDAGLRGTDAPGSAEFQPIWAEWNAKSPSEQVRDAIDADSAFMSQLVALSEVERATWRLEMFGRSQDLTGVLRMRLAEHTLHTWDIEVVGDPGATLLADAVPIVLSGTPDLVQRVAKPVQSPIDVEIRTTDPQRTALLSVGTEGATMTLDQTDSRAPATVIMPAEAFVRLVYGRLDPGHTPAEVSAVGIELDLLRTALPGF